MTAFARTAVACLLLAVVRTAEAVPIGAGDRVVAHAVAEVHGAAGAAARTGSQPVGSLGTATVRRVIGSTAWWQVDFAAGADGWVREGRLALAYFPPPEAAGGWRTLIQLNATPTAAQKAEIRRIAGVDWTGLLHARQYSAGFATGDAMLVIRNGYIVGEWGHRRPWGVASVSKSLTGLVMARLFELAAAGTASPLLKSSERMWRLLPSSWGQAEPARQSITVGDAMTMVTGLVPHDNPNGTDYLDVVMRQPVKVPRRTEWSYASLPVDLLSVAVQRTTGRSVARLFNELVAAPVGMLPVEWGTFSGYTGASSRARLAARELARVGYLMLMRGRWRDPSGGQRPVLRTDSVMQLLRGCCTPAPPLVATPGSPFPMLPDAPAAYGHLWWTNRTGTALGPTVPRDAFYAHGYRETLLVVVPSRNLVVVRYGSLPIALPGFRQEFMRRVMAALAN